VALTLVLAVAVGTRLGRLDLIEFKADEAQVAGLALDAAHGLWPAASIATSNGVDNPPLPLYLFALPALFTRDPAWLAAASGLLDVLAVLLVFVIGRRYFGGRAGLAGAAFYAAAAYPALFARKLAGPYLQPFFAALLLWCLLAIATASPLPPKRERARVREPGRWLWAAAVLALGALVQIHLGALLLAPVLAVLLALDVWRRRSWGQVAPVLVGLGLVAALFAPYLAYETGRRPNFLGIVGGAAQGTAAWSGEAFALLWVALTSPAYGDLTGSLAGLFGAESWPARYVTLLSGVAAVGGLLVTLRRCRDRRYATLAVLVLLPLMLTLRHGAGLQIHYFAFLLPAAFLLAGIGFDALLSMLPALRAPGFVALALLLATQTINFRHFTEFLERHSLPDAYGLPLSYQQRLFEEASAFAGGQRLLVASSGRDQAETARYFLRGLANSEVEADSGLLLPKGGGVYVAFSRGTAAAHALEVALAPAYVEPLPGGRLQAAIYQLPADALGSITQGMGLRPVATDWSNGMRLVGVSAPRSLPAQLAAAWQVTAPVAGSTIVFNQLLDDDGRQWFDRDAVPVEGSEWLPGDGLITLTSAAFASNAPRQEYWWSLGLYQEEGRRVALPDGALQLRVARLKGGMPSPPSAGLRSVDAVFGGAIRLQGYALSAGEVTLQWACLAPVDRDFTVFVHALGASGAVGAQADAQPDHYPTSLWDPGETIVDHHALTIPAGAQLEVGLYDLTTGTRLKLADGSDHVTLGALT